MRSDRAPEEELATRGHESQEEERRGARGNKTGARWKSRMARGREGHGGKESTEEYLDDSVPSGKI